MRFSSRRFATTGLYVDNLAGARMSIAVKSVGVQGDERTYEEVCSLRAVTSEDAMTSRLVPLSA
jgi:GMP synthase (glutamine-hydrolysing)